MKDCKLCKQTLPLDQFNKASKTTYSSYCKKCKRNLNKKEYLNKSDNWKQYYKDNKDIKQQYYLDNKESHKERARNWVYNNPERASENWKKYYQSNKDKINQYSLDKYHNDPQVKIAHLHRNRLNTAIQTKSKHSLEYLGCSIKEVMSYLESQFLNPMSWENHGDIWEIDHIKPLCNFNLKNEDECKVAFHYTNLQPLFTTSGIAEEHSYIGYTGNRNKKKLWKKKDIL